MRNTREIQLTSKAKINLGLDIASRRADGYHEIRTVMQALALGDEIIVTCSPDSGEGAQSSGRRHRTAEDGCVAIRLTCPGTDLPCDERNLAYRAARLLVEEMIRERAFAPIDVSGCAISIDIRKRIPAAAGLAGGSSDAAAVLIAMNELFDLGLSQQELMKLGLRLGADVPFCILQGTALAQGVGEELEPLPAPPPIPVLLVKPAVDVSTRWAYESWDSLTAPEHPDIDTLCQRIRGAGKQNYLQTIAPLLGNSFEALVFARYPQVRRIKEDMLDLGAAGALMSGSGPTVFGLFEDEESMARAADQMRERWPDAFVCETYTG